MPVLGCRQPSRLQVEMDGAIDDGEIAMDIDGADEGPFEAAAGSKSHKVNHYDVSCENLRLSAGKVAANGGKNFWHILDHISTIVYNKHTFFLKYNPSIIRICSTQCSLGVAKFGTPERRKKLFWFSRRD